MRALPVLTLIAALAFAGASFIAPFDGSVGRELPIPQEDPPIQPAGWAFSIWGLIYAWLILSAAFGMWKRFGDAEWDRVRAPLLLSLVLGIPWLWIAVASTFWAVVVIFLMAATAIAAFLRAPDRDAWLLRAPVGLYAGWLTAASFVALAILLAGYGIVLDGRGWAVAGILAALTVTVAVQARQPRAPAYGLAVAWALFGVAVRNGGEALGITLLAAAGILAVGATLWFGRRRINP